MTAAAAVLFTAALCIWLAPAGYILGSAVRDRQHQREDARRRTEQDREVTPEWLALLAATERDADLRPTRLRVHGEGRGMVMSDTRVLEARAARDEAMEAATDAADVRLVLAVDKVIAEAIESGEPFSSNTIRDRMPTVRPGLIGARIKAASMRKEPRLVRVGEEPSTLRSTHAKPVAVWQVAR